MRTRPIAIAATAVLLAGGATVASATNAAPESYVFVARGDNPVDALGTAPLAGRLNAPVVLTETSTLNPAAADSLRDHDPDNVVIAGGPTAISADVEATIKALLPDADVRRVAGGTRYETAAEIAALFGDIDPSFLAVDGKANEAELADLATRATMADDSDALGGLADDEYQFSIVDRQGEVVTGTFPDYDPDVTGEQSVVRVLDDITFTAPEDGLITVFPTASGAGGFAMLDATEADALLLAGAPGDDDDFASALGKIVGVSAFGFFPLAGASFVEAGEHTISFYATGEAESEYQFAYRSLIVTYQSQATGTWEPFEAPPAEATRRFQEQWRRQMNGE